MLELFILAFLNYSQSTSLEALPPSSLENLKLISPAKVPEKKTAPNRPSLLDEERVAVWAHDMDSGKNLFSQNIHRPQPIASLTKIMTFLIIYEDLALDEVVTVDLEATKTTGAGIELFQYERLTVETLLEAILIPSANDAAVALAIHHSGSQAAFAKVMNERAKQWGFKTAQFYNATGLDVYLGEEDTNNDEDWSGNQMSAYEVGLMTKRALQIPFFSTTVAKDEFFGTSVDEKFAHNKKSTNQLLGSFLGSQGVKTGFTNLAGQCLVHLSRRDDGVEILSVVLGSPDRFQETKNILTWIWDSFVWR